MLNDWLFGRLQEIFGYVKPENEGKAAIFSIREIGGKFRANVIKDGENYAVDCPYCTDTRHRLSFSYTYGMKMKQPDGRIAQFPPLAHCFNETLCMESPIRRRELFKVVMEGRPPMLFHKIKAERPEPEEVAYPSQLEPINKLSTDHVAVEYLRDDRSFDIEFLADCGFAWCESDPRPFVAKRIFIPVFDAFGDRAGGQCRLPFNTGEEKVPPKYYTLCRTPVGSVLFNMHRVQQRELVVVVEGPMDALRLPDCAVATFGANVTAKQFMMLKEWPVVIFAYDPDLSKKNPVAYQNYLDVIEDMKRRTLVGQLTLPEGRDPASMKKEDLWAMVAKERDRLQSLTSAR